MKKTFKFFIPAIFLFLFSPAFGQSNCIVAFYPFNNNANDESGNGNNGTVHGATLTADRFGNLNSAYSFNGKDDYISVDDNSNLDFSGNGTISLWVKYDQANVGTLLWKRVNSGSMGWTIYCGFPDTLITYDNENAIWLLTKTSAGAWYNITLTSNSDTTRLYVDGHLKSSKVNHGGFESSGAQLLIGTDENGSYFNGVIDDVAIYNCALDSAQINSFINPVLGVAGSGASENDIRVYPNPASDKLIVEVRQQGRISVLNTAGSVIETFGTTDPTANIDISALPKGLYFIKVETENGIAVKKIVKE